MTRTQHPLAEEYFDELRRSAVRLPKQQRTELLAELRSHLDSGVAEADSEADVRNMLDALGAPDDIVAAAAPPSPDQIPTGRLAFGVGILALVLLPTLVPPVALGVVAIILGIRARRALRLTSQPGNLAIVAVIFGAVAVVVPVIMGALLAGGS